MLTHSGAWFQWVQLIVETAYSGSSMLKKKKRKKKYMQDSSRILIFRDYLQSHTNVANLTTKRGTEVETWSAKETSFAQHVKYRKHVLDDMFIPSQITYKSSITP